MSQKYKMTISRLTVDKLGIRLYDRVSAVIAEMVANSYDADATEVVISAPMGKLLAEKSHGNLVDLGFEMQVSDNGHGMVSNSKINEINEFYLKVGAERRNDPRRGDRSRTFGRRVMGRKGVGKLAPFGVCERIEVITSGGEKVIGLDEKGKSKKGFVTSHFILDRKKIMWETDEPYFPTPGKLDGVIRSTTGTTIKMTVFDHRRVPNISDFERQMSQRFGLATPTWKIILRDSSKNSGDADAERTVGSFETKLKPGTKISFKLRKGKDEESRNQNDYQVQGPDDADLDNISAGFKIGDKFYPITGWVGYAKEPYKDDLMAGIRIYCRGKIAAQTAVFNIKAGFTGEHDVRSYLIGELHTDWLDEEEDLIRTDRQDILWSHDLGQSFQEWGQGIVKVIGKLTREPMRKSAWESFKEISEIEKKVEDLYPGKERKEIRDRTLEMAETIAKAARKDELEDEEVVESFVQLSLLLGPHVTLDKQLKEAADSKDRPMAVVSEVLRTARIAELASFGRIVDDRIRVINTVTEKKDAKGTKEEEFQKLLSEAPWLINPSWSPITANQSFETLRTEFSKYYKKITGEDLVLNDFTDPNKRADFILSNQDSEIQIIEIKRPDHKLTNAEMERIVKYHDLMSDFLSDGGNVDFKGLFSKFKITLVCDGISLTGSAKAAFEGYKKTDVLSQINWTTFLLRTRKAHEEFLHEADRQRKIATKGPK